jgi:hypothetical protein
MKQNKRIRNIKLKALKRSDFDGHTCFKTFTPEQKLQWLSNSAQFWCIIQTEQKAKRDSCSCG